MSTDADDNNPFVEGSMRYEHRMSDSDALMWAIEKDPMLRSTITTVVVLDGPVDISELRRTHERLSRVVPRLRQRVRSNPLSLAPPRWEVDPHFDLNYHLRFASAPGDGTMRDILAFAEPIAMQGFDRARPLWESTYVTAADGTSALIMKIHHAITDGVGGVKLMLELFDLEPDAPRRSMPPAPTVNVLNQVERFADAFTHQARRQLGMAKRLGGSATAAAAGVVADPVASVEAGVEMAESVGRLLAPASHPLSPIMTGRSLSSHFDILQLPLTEMKSAGHATGGKLNDAFVGGILLGIRKYHRRRGAELEALRMGMPINVRTEADQDKAGNAFVPARFEIPVDSDDPAVLMENTHHRLFEVVHEPANALVEPLSNFINRLPTTVTTGLFGSMMRGLDFQASNVPGSPFPMYLLGVPVRFMVPFGPLAGAASNITLLSYQQDLNIGVNVDPAAVTDPAAFVECLREGFDEVMALGAAPHRKGPAKKGAAKKRPAKKGAAKKSPATTAQGGKRARATSSSA